MRIILSISTVLIILSVFSQCKKTDDSKIVISGILARDEQGNLQAAQGDDTSDWGFNQSIPSEIETQLKGLPMQFSTYTSSVFDPLNPNGEVSTGVYPNPSSGNFTFYALLRDTSYACTFVVVDKNLKVYGSGSVAGGMKTLVSIPNLPQGLYRVYYMYFDAQMHVLYRGYGDISKQ